MYVPLSILLKFGNMEYKDVWPEIRYSRPEQGRWASDPLQARATQHTILTTFYITSYFLTQNQWYRISLRALMVVLTLLPQAPRGLSAADKRVKLQEIFHESVGSTPGPMILRTNSPFNLIQKDFFQLKELEKLGPKLKGIGTPYPLLTNASPSLTSRVLQSLNLSKKSFKS